MDKLKKNCKTNVSVIVPTYNGSKYIVATIDSLLEQTVKFAEIIIIDDASTDNTCDVIHRLLSKYKDKSYGIQFVQRTENCGPSQVRNHGLKLASHEWIMFMDHDDLAEPNMLETELHYLDGFGKKENCVLVHCACSQIDSNGRFLSDIHRWKEIDNKQLLGYCFVRNQILSMSGVLLKKEYVVKAGGLDIRFRFSHDWDLWLKLAHEGGFGYIDKPLVRIRRHIGNTSSNVHDFQKDEIAILRKYDVGYIQRAVFQRNLPDETNYLDFASILFKLNLYDRANDMVQQVIQQNPQCTRAHFFSGVYYWQQNRWQEAESEFELVLQLEPLNAAAQNNLGCIRLALGDREKAQYYFQCAVSNLSNYLDATSNLKLIENNREITFSDLRFTFRELRTVLTTYSALS